MFSRPIAPRFYHLVRSHLQFKEGFFARLFSGSKIKSDLRSCRDGIGEKEAKVGSKGGCSRGKTKIISCISAFLQGERRTSLYYFPSKIVIQKVRTKGDVQF